MSTVFMSKSGAQSWFDRHGGSGAIKRFTRLPFSSIDACPVFPFPTWTHNHSARRTRLARREWWCEGFRFSTSCSFSCKGQQPWIRTEARLGCSLPKIKRCEVWTVDCKCSAASGCPKIHRLQQTKRPQMGTCFLTDSVNGLLHYQQYTYIADFGTKGRNTLNCCGTYFGDIYFCSNLTIDHAFLLRRRTSFPTMNTNTRDSFNINNIWAFITSFQYISYS